MNVEKPSPLKAAFLATRPPTLLLGAGPIVLGGILAVDKLPEGREFSWFWFVLTLLTGLLLQVGANLVNDVKDSEKGVDQIGRRLGPARVTMLGWLPVRTVRNMYLASFALALLFACAVAWQAGPGFLVLGILCCLVAYGYTAGPKPLAYIGLGEMMAFIFFGPVAVLGTMSVQTKSLNWDSFALASSTGFIAAAVMAINNVRDMQSDQAAGKLTLPLMLGQSVGSYLPHLFLLFAIFIPALAWPQSYFMQSLIYVGLALLFVQLLISGTLAPKNPQYNMALKRTSMFMLVQAITLGYLQRRWF